MPITRGFSGRRRGDGVDGSRSHPDRAGRLPPGQYDVGDSWPVLTAEAAPVIDPARWRLDLDGLVEQPQTWDLTSLQALPGSTYAGDIHCVTTWSRFAMTFRGVAVDTLFAAAGVRPEAAYVVVHSETGYTTNLPLADVVDGRAWVVWEADGRPLTPEHGGPVRFLVPHLYFWKSAKWVTRIELVDVDRPGFWETHGYHDRGDPWLEQRYQGD